MIDRELPNAPTKPGAGLRSPLRMACWAGLDCLRLASCGEPTHDHPSGAGIWGIPAPYVKAPS